MELEYLLGGAVEVRFVTSEIKLTKKKLCGITVWEHMPLSLKVNPATPRNMIWMGIDPYSQKSKTPIVTAVALRSKKIQPVISGKLVSDMQHYLSFLFFFLFSSVSAISSRADSHDTSRMLA